MEDKWQCDNGKEEKKLKSDEKKKKKTKRYEKKERRANNEGDATRRVETVLKLIMKHNTLLLNAGYLFMSKAKCKRFAED